MSFCWITVRISFRKTKVTLLRIKRTYTTSILDQKDFGELEQYATVPMSYTCIAELKKLHSAGAFGVV